MLRNDLIRKKQRRNSLPSSLKAMRIANTAGNAASNSTIIDQPTSLDNVNHQSAIEAFQLLLDSQRKELADKDAALESLKNNREIIISTVAVDKLTGLPTFKSVESWALQFSTNIHLKVMKNIAVEAKQAIEYEANTRGLTVNEEWTTLHLIYIEIKIEAKLFILLNQIFFILLNHFTQSEK